jgi:hypothetical protein
MSNYGKGRPKVYSVSRNLRLDQTLAAQVNQFRHQRGLDTDVHAIREILRVGLAVSGIPALADSEEAEYGMRDPGQSVIYRAT